MSQNNSNKNNTLFGGITWDPEFASKVTSGFNNADEIMKDDLPKILNEYSAASITSGNPGPALITTAIDRFIALPAEIRKDGLIKGTISWGIGSIGATFGLAKGTIKFIKTGNPTDIYKNIIKYGDLADSYADKGVDLIGNSFKKLFGRDSSKGTLTDPAASLTQSILNKDLSSNLKGATTAQATNIAGQNLPADYYNHPEVNTDPTQRVLGKNGAPTDSPKLDSGASKSGLAPASDPASLTKAFKTPNMQSITKVLYSGVKLGASMLTGYLVGRATEVVLGKTGAKIVGKIQEIKGYYNAATWAMKTFASSTWTAITNSALGQANNIRSQ